MEPTTILHETCRFDVNVKGVCFMLEAAHIKLHVIRFSLV